MISSDLVLKFIEKAGLLIETKSSQQDVSFLKDIQKFLWEHSSHPIKELEVEGRKAQIFVVAAWQVVNCLLFTDDSFIDEAYATMIGSPCYPLRPFEQYMIDEVVTTIGKFETNLYMPIVPTGKRFVTSLFNLKTNLLEDFSGQEQRTDMERAFIFWRHI